MQTIKFQNRWASNATDKAIAELYDSRLKFDMQMVVAGEKIVEAHEFVMTLFSEELEEIIDNMKKNDKGIYVVELKDYSYTVMKKLVELFYFREVVVPKELAKEVMAAVKKLRVVDIQEPSSHAPAQTAVMPSQPANKVVENVKVKVPSSLTITPVNQKAPIVNQKTSPVNQKASAANQMAQVQSAAKPASKKMTAAEAMAMLQKTGKIGTDNNSKKNDLKESKPSADTVAIGRSQLTISKVQRQTKPNAQSGQMVENQPKGADAQQMPPLPQQATKNSVDDKIQSMLFNKLTSCSIVPVKSKPQSQAQVPMKPTVQATSSNGQVTQNALKNVTQSTAAAAMATRQQVHSANNESGDMDVDETCKSEASGSIGAHPKEDDQNNMIFKNENGVGNMVGSAAFNDKKYEDEDMHYSDDSYSGDD